jgi:hypothetical protein
MTRSNSRRFVNAAWSLLTFQFIASAGAVVVTGLAATHVSTIVGNAQHAAGPVMPAEAAIEEASGTAPPPEASAAPAPAASAPADATAPAPAPSVINAPPGTIRIGPDGNTLYLGFNDAAGISGAPQIQWIRDGAVVPGATGTSYDMSYRDSNSEIYARATYVDRQGIATVATSNTVRAPVFTD